MVIKPFVLLGLTAEYRSKQWLFSTLVWRPSDVYDIHWRTKLTAPKTISHSRDVENRRLNLPNLYLEVTPLEFRLDLWHQKTTVTGLSYGTVRDPRFSHLSRTPICDRQTDRHVMTASTALA